MLRSFKPSNKVYYNEKESFQTYDNKHNITLSDYKLISSVFFYILMDSIINSGKVYQLPYELGTLGVYKRPVIGRGVFDYRLYIKEGIKHWKKNYHSDSMAATIVWNNKWPRCKIPYAHIFKFTPTRYFTRELSKKIKTENTIHKYYDY